MGAGCLMHYALALHCSLGKEPLGLTLGWGRARRDLGALQARLGAQRGAKQGHGWSWCRGEPEAASVATSTCSGTESKGGLLFYGCVNAFS